MQKTAIEFAAKLKELQQSSKGFDIMKEKRRENPVLVSEPMFPSAVPVS